MADDLGQLLGNYRLVNRLGFGAFANIYLGEHIYLHNRVAVTVLPTALGDENTKQFLEEARLLANLDHPHIIRYLEFGMVDGRPFLVVDYAPGGSLRSRFPRGTQLLPELVLKYTRDLADALQYIHDRGIIHRNVKPENMLLGQDDRILLSDFGIAVHAKNVDHAAAAGTPAYMAPEQFRGKAQFASDQYALGMVVYEWLSGERPFKGLSFKELATRSMAEPPPPLREKVPAISSTVEQVVLRALAKNPEDRFPSVRAFADALEEAILSEQAIITDIDARRSSVRLRIQEYPLISRNLVFILSALTELYTKCWLIHKGRFVDLVDYAQTHSVHFEEEAPLVITRLCHNSPLNIKLDVSFESIAKAFETVLNAVIGVDSKKKKVELDNKALEEAINQKRREADSIFADKEQARQREVQIAWVEHQQGLIDLEKRQLQLKREQVEFELQLVDRALDMSRTMTDILYPDADPTTKAIAAQTLIKNILQLSGARGLELVQLVSQEEMRAAEQGLSAHDLLTLVSESDKEDESQL